jgi:hypothetical protein
VLEKRLRPFEDQTRHPCRCRDHTVGWVKLLTTLLLVKYNTVMKDISTQEASAVLNDIRETQSRVISQGPREYVPFIG